MKVPKLLGTGFVPTTKRFERLGLGVEGEQNSWLHLAGLWFAFPMNNRLLVDLRPNLTMSVSLWTIFIPHTNGQLTFLDKVWP